MESGEPCYTPPCFTIDLSLAPEERYKEITRLYSTQLQSLTGLFNGLLLDLAIPPALLPIINRVSRYILRRVHDDDQTRELKGIAEVTKIPMYLLVAFNVVLDLMMGCTSGGVISREKSQSQSLARMLHFRTLDWTMDPLREVVVQLDFIQSNSSDPRKVVASSITYVGFVGVLTGVRRGLSMSLNFRAVHDATSRKDHFKFYLRHVLVLLGRKPSIASVLRSYLLRGFEEDNSDQSDADRARQDLISQHTTAAYIVLSDGKVTYAVEKDYNTAQVSSSNVFVARTNHDVMDHHGFKQPAPAATSVDHESSRYMGLEGLLEESRDRLDCIEEKWKDRVQYLRSRARGKARTTFSDHDAYVTKQELIEWVSSWTTTNERTHFAAIMDPTTGDLVWSVAYREPIEEPDCE